MHTRRIQFDDTDMTGMKRDMPNYCGIVEGRVST